MKLTRSFYTQKDTISLAQQLLGKVLCTNIDGKFSSGIICETEAYLGAIDKASHAYGNKLTKRTATMFEEGGKAYVYLCYGIHHLFNIVSGEVDNPQAILIRGIIPLEGIEQMLQRRNRQKLNPLDFIGPGKVSQALAITTKHNSLSLLHDELWIEDRGIKIDASKIKASPRVGIDYAEEDAALPYRFQIFEQDLK